MDSNILSQYIEKEVIVSLSKGAYSSSTKFSGAHPYFKGIILDVTPKFILLKVNNKKDILVNIDYIVTVELNK